MESSSAWWPAPIQSPAEQPAEPEQQELRWPRHQVLEHPGSKQSRNKRGGVAGVLAAIVAFAAKFKAILLLLPKLKLLTTVGTMLVSVAAYSFVFGWPFAVGFVVLIFVHEMGHVIALRREGIKASAPMFIPFLGAVISAKSLGRNATAEARVGLAGPILGTIGAAVCIVIWQATGNDLWRALAFTGFFLNLFNLLPVVPLDGGRIVAAIHPALWVLGLVGLLALVIFRPNGILVLILVFAALELWQRWKARQLAGSGAYYSVKPWQRLTAAVSYFGLAALLVVGMHATHVPHSF